MDIEILIHYCQQRNRGIGVEVLPPAGPHLPGGIRLYLWDGGYGLWAEDWYISKQDLHLLPDTALFKQADAWIARLNLKSNQWFKLNKKEDLSS